MMRGTKIGHDFASVHFKRDRRSVSSFPLCMGRLSTGLIIFCCVWLIFTVRVVDLALVDHPGYQHHDVASSPGSRADIVDRHGVLLARSIPTKSLGIDPRQVEDRGELIDQLLLVLPDLRRLDLEQALQSGKHFIWVKRSLTPSEIESVLWLGLPGLQMRDEQRRIYPHGRLAAHVIGFADRDQRGLAGLERSMEDRLGQGLDISTTMDVRIQHIMHAELGSTMQRYKASAGAGVVLDAQTAEVISLVSLPDFDPHHPARQSANLFNRATLGLYEIGSPLKLFTAAMALDSGTSHRQRRYDVGQPLHIGTRVVRDYRPRQGDLNVDEIIRHSSNIGAAQLGLDLGAERQRFFLKRFGLSDRLDIEILEKARPILPQRWDINDVVSVSFGYAAALTPLHVAAASAALVNGGTFRQPTLIHDSNPGDAIEYRAISAKTSSAIRDLMRQVVQSGTGRAAYIGAYDIGGKTGTANRISSRGYDKDANIVSFVGAFPMVRPRYVVFALLENPRPLGQTNRLPTGGGVMAPMVRRVIERMAPLIGVTALSHVNVSLEDSIAPVVLTQR